MRPRVPIILGIVVAHYYVSFLLAGLAFGLRLRSLDYDYYVPPTITARTVGLLADVVTFPLWLLPSSIDFGLPGFFANSCLWGVGIYFVWSFRLDRKHKLDMTRRIIR